ncbi:MAG: ECF-type sigma factor [Acidobacteriota bacterium]|nr:ECF-type sigma factor [Acidobacteriota bacterium]
MEELLPLVYAELRRLAAGYLRRERVGHTLQPTALVHEAYLRMVDQTQVRWQNRAHFFGGLSVEETAEVLGVSAPTVKRHWRLAKAWLFGQIQKQ